MIWEYGIIPRTIHISYEQNWRRATQAILKSKRIPYPKLLSICQESRKFGLQTYELLFGRSLNGNGIYFSWKLDTLYLDSDGTVREFFRNRYFIMGVPVPVLPPDLLEVSQKLRHVAFGDRGQTRPMVESINALGGSRTSGLWRLQIWFKDGFLVTKSVSTTHLKWPDSKPNCVQPGANTQLTPSQDCLP